MKRLRWVLSLAFVLALPALALVLAIGGEQVSTLQDLYSRIWSRGAAGVDVPLRVLQGGEVRELSVRSMDRMDYFRSRPVH